MLHAFGEHTILLAELQAWARAISCAKHQCESFNEIPCHFGSEDYSVPDFSKLPDPEGMRSVDNAYVTRHPQTYQYRMNGISLPALCESEMDVHKTKKAR